MRNPIRNYESRLRDTFNQMHVWTPTHAWMCNWKYRNLSSFVMYKFVYNYYYTISLSKGKKSFEILISNCVLFLALLYVLHTRSRPRLNIDDKRGSIKKPIENSDYTHSLSIWNGAELFPDYLTVVELNSCTMEFTSCSTPIRCSSSSTTTCSKWAIRSLILQIFLSLQSLILLYFVNGRVRSLLTFPKRVSFT